MSPGRLQELLTQATYSRERYQLYQAKAYGTRPTSETRLRELRVACETAEARLRAAQDEVSRASGHAS